MNYVVYLLLFTVDNEERCFWLLVGLMVTVNWDGIYSDETPKLVSVLQELKRRLIKEEEAVMKHFLDEDVRRFKRVHGRVDLRRGFFCLVFHHTVYLFDPFGHCIAHSGHLLGARRRSAPRHIGQDDLAQEGNHSRT